MRTIRQNIFETNSSSTHSISIAEGSEEDLMDTNLNPDEDGNITLYGGRFGWEIEYFHSADDKASYLAIYVKDWVEREEEKESMLSVLENVIKTQTGANNIIYNLDDSYIDHQSVDGRDLDYLWEDLEKMRQFIFNPRSYLKTDNDNH